jgi:hypothetical protein
MIVSKNKKFDPKLHEQADEPAKTVTKFYVGRFGYDAEDNPNIYGVDLIVPDVCYIEVERRFMWKEGDKFPFWNLHIPHRKRKFFNLDMPTLVFTWNYALTHFIRLHEDVIKNSPVIEKATEAMPEGEHFYEVNLSQGKIVKFT